MAWRKNQAVRIKREFLALLFAVFAIVATVTFVSIATKLPAIDYLLVRVLHYIHLNHGLLYIGLSTILAFLVFRLGLDQKEYLELQAKNEDLERIKQAKVQQGAIVKLATHPAIVNGQVDEAARVITEVASTALGVARSSIWLSSANGKEIRCLCLYDRMRHLPVESLVLMAADYPIYFEALRSGRAVDAVDAASDPRTSEFAETYLRKLRIVSMLDAPIRVRGRVIGILCNESVDVRRNWSNEEISFAADIADQMAQAFINQEQQMSQQALQQSEGMLRQLTENINEIFWLSSPDKKVVYYISPAFEEIWGMACQYHIEHPLAWLETVHHEDRDRVKEALPQQVLGTYDIEYRICRPDGAIRWIRDRAFPIKDQNENVVRLAGISEDITSIKISENSRLEHEKRALQSQKMEALGVLAGGIAHDFNNILSSIIGYSELIRNNADSETVLRKNVESVLIGAYRAKDLVKQILTFTRQTEVKLEPIVLPVLLEEVIKLLQGSLPGHVTVKLKIIDPCCIHADTNQIFQLLMNLCSNGIYAMKDRGGCLEICLERAEFEKNDCAKITVSDDGIGIPRDIRDKIFDPFFTTKPLGEGTGLGLSVADGVVKKHGGHIAVYSTEGSGTKFEVYLPLKTAIIKIQTKEQSLKAAASAKVVFVDDEVLVASLGREVLRKSGYEVITFSDSQKALDYIQDHKDCDLLISDLSMPLMNGSTLAKKAKESNPHIKVILCSGYGSNKNIENSSADAFLDKPFSIEQLLLLADSLLKKGTVPSVPNCAHFHL